MESNSVFKLKSVTSLKDANKRFKKGQEVVIETSDLALQYDDVVYQFSYHKKGKDKLKKYTIYPGVYNLASTNNGIELFDLEFKVPNLLELGNHTEEIITEFDKFFKNLEVYKKYDQPVKRNLLLYGPPGVGKTSSIVKSCLNLIEEDAGTVIINWNSSSIRSSDVLDFFQVGSKYDSTVTRLVILIEDIGMQVEGYGGPKEVDRALLNFLDGAAVSFQYPTMNIATTNHIHNLPENLVNRPGRFDKHIKVDYPTPEQRVELYKFISKEDLSVEDVEIISSAKCNEFTTAHLNEIFIRSKIDKRSLKEVVEQLYSHAKLFKKGFSEKTGIAKSLL